MATLADLKQSIINDIGRDDLESELSLVLLDHIRRAVRKYDGRNWWFLNRTTTATCTPGQGYVTRPTTVERIRRVSIPALGFELDREDLAMLEMYDEPTAQSGQPSCYAEGEAGTQLRLWPTPNSNYSLKIVGTRLYAELTSDTDSNPWTNEGCDLIAARTRYTICRDVLRDPEGVTSAGSAVSECLADLELTGIDRAETLVPANW